LRQRLERWVDPADAFGALYATDSYAFWLDAGSTAVSGLSRMGAAIEGDAIITASVADGTVTESVLGGGPAVTRRGSVFELLRSATGGAAAGASVENRGELWVGWLGYELGAAEAGAPTAASRYPDASLMRVGRHIIFDHAAKTVTLIGVESAVTEDWITSTRSVLTALPSVSGSESSAGSPESVPEPMKDRDSGPSPAARWRHADDGYLAMIAACQDAIARGDAYQLCLTNELRIDAHPDPVRTYRSLRTVSPTASGGFLRFGELSLLSASPERFLSISSDRVVTTRPIKGTRRRGATRDEDERLRDELLASEKERAENLMIVDLVRNDLGQIAELGSVEVTDLLEVVSYAQVHQLVSTVTARLADGVHPVDAVAACFPAGSMTGAPKLSAMGILHDLEHGPRGIYSGCFGLFTGDGTVELAMVIRSIVLDGSGASIGSGGGITALSDPGEELAEVRLKAAVLAAVVGASINL
jgi:anthranilate/para-aminobenzoate synthase component I